MLVTCWHEGMSARTYQCVFGTGLWADDLNFVVSVGHDNVFVNGGHHVESLHTTTNNDLVVIVVVLHRHQQCS
jgi:hypothetical protein